MANKHAFFEKTNTPLAGFFRWAYGVKVEKWNPWGVWPISTIISIFDTSRLIILIIQTLGLMFRETEIFPTRLRVLRANAGRLLCDLIEVLTCFPELPNKYKPPTTKASKLLMQTEADKWKCLADAEVCLLWLSGFDYLPWFMSCHQLLNW